MRRATEPCKQLNSDEIKGATLGYMSPVIAGQCSIVSAKGVWNVSEKDLPKSWNNICKKRDLCDRAVSFKSISRVQKSRNKVSSSVTYLCDNN